jgi:4-alpha-glucanotransferase
VITRYEDVFGEMHTCPETTVRAILGEMGFDASSEASAAAALCVAQEELWRRMLDPIYIVEVGRPAQLAISVSSDAGPRLEWRLAREDGTTTAGTAVVAEMPGIGAPEGIGAPRESIGGVTYSRRRLILAEPLEPGYHSFSLHDGTRECRATIASVPAACYVPPHLGKRGVWGLAAQLYSLRSRRGAGIGDFTDLRNLCAVVAAAGGAAVGTNPLHELTFAGGTAPSPYAPSSRVFLNWIYLAIESLPGFEPTEAFPGFEPADPSAASRVAPSASELIDYEPIAAAKLRAARAAYERFYDSDIAPGTSAAALDFKAFVRAGGDALRAATAFNVLRDHFSHSGDGARWQDWPAAFQDPASPSVARFIAERARDVEFYAYLQWQADLQLAAASGAGLPVGLYRDLAVGADLSGADTWAHQATLRSGVSVGAPPDILNPRGQAWGVAPFDPLALRAVAYEPFIALLRANMRHAGVLRIDHVMALARLWWVPEGAEPSAGAYVAYRLEELVGLIALESRRACCMVVGEDLGTVPDGLREQLRRACILSYRLLQFEQDDARFFAPDEYPAVALVSTGTHDLPPIGSYFIAHDVDVRAALGLIDGGEAAQHERDERVRKRDRFLKVLREIGLPEPLERRFRAAAERPAERETLAEIALWANRYLARSPCRLLMVQLEDLLGEIEQVNMPSTTDEHPNWRRRTSIEIDDLASDPRFVALVAALQSEHRGSEHRSWDRPSDRLDESVRYAD